MKEFNLFLALEKLDLELTITEINSELERLLDLKQLINLYTEPKFNPDYAIEKFLIFAY